MPRFYIIGLFKSCWPFFDTKNHSLWGRNIVGFFDRSFNIRPNLWATVVFQWCWNAQINHVLLPIRRPENNNLFCYACVQDFLSNHPKNVVKTVRRSDSNNANKCSSCLTLKEPTHCNTCWKCCSRKIMIQFRPYDQEVQTLLWHCFSALQLKCLSL